MVSPTISSPKLQPLSYADHAKKAQNIKTPSSPHPPRIVPHYVPSTSGSSDSSATPYKPLSISLALDPKSDAAVDVATPTVASCSSPSTTDALVTINGDTRPRNALVAKALSVVAAHTSSQKSPIVNVWNIRKEQLAAARAALTKALVKEIPPESQVVSEPMSPQNTVPSISPFTSTSAPNTLHGPSATVNGVTSTRHDEEHDLFIVHTNIKTTPSTKPLPPPVDDTDSWPEVGKATASTHSAPNPTAIRPSGGVTRNGPENDQILASVSRKGEKTKWLPIPSKEFQATADSLANPSKQHNRKRSQQSNNLHLAPRSGTHTVGGSASGSASSQSRGHSASHSAPHSRVQSPSESLQSSPRVPRDRHLPTDDTSGASGQGTWTTRRSSRPGSPPLVVQPHLQPLRPAIDLKVFPSNAEHPTPRYTQVGIQTSGDPASSHPPSAQRRHLTPQTMQFHYHPTTHIPTHPQRSSYPRQGGTPPLLPVHYTKPGAPFLTNTPYATHDYHNSAPPYGYRKANQSHPGSGTQSPAFPPLQAGPLYYLTHFALTYPRQQQPQQYRPPRSGVPRPMPPEQSQAVAGYKEAAVGKEYPVVFGSVGIPGASQSPSPAPLHSWTNNCRDGALERGEDKWEDEPEKAFTTFSIGVAPGDGPSRLRARTLSSKARSWTAIASTSESEVKTEGEAESSTPGSAESNTIDLTESQELKWEFGTATSSLRDDGFVRSPSISPESPQIDIGAHSSLHETLPPVLTSITGFGIHSGMVYRSTSGSPAEVLMEVQPGSVSVPVEGALLAARLCDVASGDDFEVKDFGYGFGPASGTGRALVVTREERDERERGYMREREREGARIERERERMERVERERTERIERELQRERMERERIKRELQRGREMERIERDLQREPAVVKDYGYERDQEETVRDIRDMDVPVHPKRGSFNEGVGYDRGERGVRRGRGMNGFGRGYPNRRGSGFQQHQPLPPPPPPLQQQQQPFTITPPQNIFQPLQTVSDPPKNYPQHLSPYVPPGYENYLPPTTSSTAAPPLPVPVTAISFPLDPTRWYVLGQLEYYLSPQNMAQDLFLRQQMDARGWVPVSLIASFNRVRQLTMDVHLVRDVLLLSSMVQVKGDWVRMKGWEQFVFPDAAASGVEDDEHPETYDQPFQEEKGDLVEMYGDFHAHGEHAYGEPLSYSEVHDDTSAAKVEQQDGDVDGDSEGDNDDDDYGDETDDEEDVVFVMSHDDEGQPWPPERVTSS